MDKHQEVRLQFLEEAQEYIAQIESGLLGAGDRGTLASHRLDAILRAAHSIKGGAAMMGYPALSDLSHRLEDFFKLIKVGASPLDGSLEGLLLAAVDCLGHCLHQYRQGVEEIPAGWLAGEVNPLLAQLRERLGDLQPEDTAAILAQESGEDMVALLFQTEVEACLQRLAGALEGGDSPCLREEFLLAAQELGGLAEMLELSAFQSLCASIEVQLEGAEVARVLPLARGALETWQRSQALVLTDQLELLPQQFHPDASPSSLPELDSLLALESWSDQDLSFLSTPTPAPVPTAEPEPLPPAAADNTIRVSARQLEQLGDLFGELIVERNGLNLQLKGLRQLVRLLGQRLKALDTSNRSLRSAYDKSLANSVPVPVPVSAREMAPASHPQAFDLLELDRYGNSHLLFQTLMETIVQIEEVTGDLDLNLEGAQRTARDLTRTSQLMFNRLQSLRLRPLSDIFDRFPRALRDMSLKYGKPVGLKVTGGSTLLDRPVLDALNEPLLHLLRNAFDHGIEDPETRAALGKPPQGTIEIAASYRGNQTVITIRDDGAGIDLDRVRNKALALGLTESDLGRLSRTDLLNLIFDPGFTTAERVTNLSGRGMGMDIVRTNLRQVRGQIQVDTQMGSGTTFTLSMPFTLSVVRTLLVEATGMMLAFPTNVVEEMVRLSEEMTFTSAGQEFFTWEGYTIPLFRLEQWFQFSRPRPKMDGDVLPAINEPSVLLLARGTGLVGVVADRYWGEEEVTIRPIEGILNLPSGLTACTILGDGRAVPLVDAPALVQWLEQQQARQQRPALPDLRAEFGERHLPPARSAEKAMVMVIDDSINVRRFVALTLEKAGYLVQQAKDGQEAIERLQEGLPIQAAICDIEMPRLDGYGFLAHVKSHPAYRQLPVVMLTSRSGDKHRQLALHLGASAYFSKPFQERDLLQSLQTLTH